MIRRAKSDQRRAPSIAKAPSARNVRFLATALAATLSTMSVIRGAPDEARVPHPVPALSPEESLARIEVLDGYRLELVAHEPMVEEPVAIAWDGNGRMYVAEMRTYMQEIDGIDQMRPVSRVMRLEDSDDDGRMDRHTVFVDRLILPRMILPLRDELIICETDTLDLYSYRDTDGDGIADEKKLWHAGGPRGGNLEHQPSGLVWAIDNWIYTTYTNHRYRFARGRVEREPLPHSSGQWGLAQDDVGKLYYSTAGGETPAMDFQQPIIYGQIAFPGEEVPGFREVFPIVHIPDVQGGRGRVRDDDTLNHFTGCAGQTIYRGDRLPADLYGDLIIPEPVGRLVRRAKVRNVLGKSVLSNAYERTEFIRSSDPNFRPLNSATGPDGCLYIVDMYRGIIQEGNWVREGSYLRTIVEEWSLDKNIGRGRIYRVVHGEASRGPRPRLLDATPEELVSALSHPNGWWRDTAQKLLVLAGERAIVPVLEREATNAASGLGRLHAHWTLEGLEAVSPALLERGMDDPDPRVRAAAIRIAERFLGDATTPVARSLEARLRRLAADADPNVSVQVLLSSQITAHPARPELDALALEKHPESDAVRGVIRSYERRLAAIEAERRRVAEIRKKNEREGRSYELGRLTYATLCITCHGADGRGAPAPDEPGRTIAPPLAGSERVFGAPDRLIRILLHGLTGPVDDTEYREQMIAMGSNPDPWIASVLSYVRNAWDQRASFITPEDVLAARRSSGERGRPWTLAELHEFDPHLGRKGEWKLSASHNSGGTRAGIDGRRASRWDTGTPQVPGMWFQIELPQPALVTGVVLDAATSPQDFPTSYVVTASLDGETWSEPVAAGRGGPDVVTHISFAPMEVRFLHIEETGTKPGLFWSIHELDVVRAPPSIDAVSSGEAADGAASRTLPSSAELLSRTGDPVIGRAVFEKNCTTCHRVAESGVLFGPELGDVGTRLARDVILQSILEPAAVVDAKYRGKIIQTNRGEFLTGLVVAETSDAITLRQQGGADRAIPKGEIAFAEDQEGTFMPAGLEKAMSVDELVSLVAYLAEQRAAPREGTIGR
jgi:putative heme-binding domain-containing protein